MHHLQFYKKDVLIPNLLQQEAQRNWRSYAGCSMIFSAQPVVLLMMMMMMSVYFCNHQLCT